MDTIVRSPVSPPTSVDSEPGKRWPRNLVALLAFLVVVGLMAGGFWVARYEPFEPGSFPAFAPADPDLRVEEVDAFGASGRVFRVRVQRGDTFMYRFSISNRGPVAVTIRRLGYPKADQVGNVVTRYPVQMIPDVWLQDDREGLPSFEPWHPFTLVPDQEAIVEMQATYERGCIDGLLGWYFEPIAFSVYGMPRETNFVTGADVRFVGTEDC